MTSKDRRHYRDLSTRSTQRQGDKRSAAADLIASHAPLREGSHKARPVSTKTLTPGDSRGSPTGAPAKAQQSGFGGERRSSGTTELLPLKAKRRMWSLRRRDGPKSRKLHQCELVGRKYVSPPNPRIKARFQRAALEPFGLSFFHIFLQTKKDMATGGRTEKRMPVKTKTKSVCNI